MKISVSNSFFARFKFLLSGTRLAIPYIAAGNNDVSTISIYSYHWMGMGLYGPLTGSTFNQIRVNMQINAPTIPTHDQKYIRASFGPLVGAAFGDANSGFWLFDNWKLPFS